MQTPEEFAAMLDRCAHTAEGMGERLTDTYRVADLIRARDAEVRAAERKRVLAGFTEVYALAWDGEPSMGGEPHRVSAGAELSEPDARRALATVGRRKPNARVERRYVTEWEPAEETPPKEKP